MVLECTPAAVGVLRRRTGPAFTSLWFISRDRKVPPTSGAAPSLQEAFCKAGFCLAFAREGAIRVECCSEDAVLQWGLDAPDGRHQARYRKQPPPCGPGRHGWPKWRMSSPDPWIYWIYGPGEAAILHPDVIAALDSYRRLLSECTKHRQTYLDLFKGHPDEFQCRGALTTYCIGLDSVVRSGLILLRALHEHHPASGADDSGLPSYRLIDEDMPDIQKALIDVPNR